VADTTELFEPVQYLLISTRRGGERLTAQPSARRIESSGVVGSRVRVDPTDDDRAVQLHVFFYDVPLRKREPLERMDRTQQ